MTAEWNGASNWTFFLIIMMVWWRRRRWRRCQRQRSDVYALNQSNCAHFEWEEHDFSLLLAHNGLTAHIQVLIMPRIYSIIKTLAALHVQMLKLNRMVGGGAFRQYDHICQVLQRYEQSTLSVQVVNGRKQQQTNKQIVLFLYFFRLDYEMQIILCSLLNS